MNFYLNKTFVKLFTEIGCISISVCLSEDVLRFLGINRGFIYLLVVCTYYIVVKISMSLSCVCLDRIYESKLLFKR